MKIELQQKKINKAMKVQGACLFQVDEVEVFVLSEYRASPTNNQKYTPYFILVTKKLMVLEPFI